MKKEVIVAVSGYFDPIHVGHLKYLKLAKNKNNERYQQKIGVVFYGDHNLIVVSANIDLNNNIKIIALNEIPVPSNVIGDSLVEDTNELANILLDSLTLLELLECPLLLVLSSSFFNIDSLNSV